MASRTSQLIVELLDRVSGPARKASTSLRGIGKAARAGEAPTFGERINSSLARVNTRLEESRAGLADTIGAFYALKGAIVAPVGAAMRFESAMADVKKVVNFTDEADLKGFEKGLLDMTRRVPLAVDGLAAIAAAAGQAGIAKNDILAFTEEAAKIGVAFDISANEAGDAMAKMMTGLGMTLPEVVSLSDAMNHLSNSQASSAAEILDVVRRTGAMGKQYGFTAEQVAAFGSAMIASGSQSDVAATSFMNMGRALTRGASATKRQRSAYKALGMDAKQVAAAMQKDAVKTTVSVMEAIAALPAEQRAAISSDLFGDEARALGPLLTNLGLVRESLGMVGDEAAYAGSATKEFAARSKTFENRLQRFRNAISRVAITLGSSLMPALTGLMEAIEPVIDKIAGWIDQNPALVSGIVGAAAAVVTFRGAVAGLRFVGLLGASGALSALSTGMTLVAATGGKLWGAARASIALQGALAGMSGLRMGAMDKIAAGLRGIAGVTGLTAIKTAIGGLIGVIGTISAPVWLGIGAAVAAVGAAWKYWDRISSVLSGVGKAIGELLAPALEAVRPVLDWFAPLGDAIAAGWERAKTAVSAVSDWLGSFFSRETLSEDDKVKYEQAGYDAIMALWNGMKSVMNSLLAWVNEKVAALLSPFAGMSAKISSYFGGEATGVTSDPMGSGVDGMRAKGGPISRGGRYLVGENGPEVITPSRSGYVHPNGSGGGSSAAQINLGGITINAPPGMDAGQIADEVIRRVEKMAASAFRSVQADVGMEPF